MHAREGGMDEVLIRPAGVQDVEVLLPLVAAYHSFEKVTLTEPERRRALADLLADPALGFVLRLDVGGMAAGYAAVCFGYSIEFGGRDAFLDEFLCLRSGTTGSARALSPKLRPARPVAGSGPSTSKWMPTMPSRNFSTRAMASNCAARSR
jgi:hypothetical protein